MMKGCSIADIVHSGQKRICGIGAYGLYNSMMPVFFVTIVNSIHIAEFGHADAAVDHA